MKNKRFLSINDVEKVIDSLLFPNESLYPPNIIDALEKIVNERIIEQRKRKCSSCDRGIYCTCWANVR